MQACFLGLAMSITTSTTVIMFFVVVHRSWSWEQSCKKLGKVSNPAFYLPYMHFDNMKDIKIIKSKHALILVIKCQTKLIEMKRDLHVTLLMEHEWSTKSHQHFRVYCLHACWRKKKPQFILHTCVFMKQFAKPLCPHNTHYPSSHNSGLSIFSQIITTLICSVVGFQETRRIVPALRIRIKAPIKPNTATENEPVAL